MKRIALFTGIVALAAAGIWFAAHATSAPRPQDAAAVARAEPARASEAGAATGDASIAELEKRFGKNLLAPDPDRVLPPKDAPDQGILRRWWGDRSNGFNVYLTNDANLVDALLVYVMHDFAPRWKNDPNRFAPGVADYASVSDDSKTVTLHIRPGIRWQFPVVDKDDPKHRWLVDRFAKEPPELTAEDIRFTLATIQDPEVDPSGYAAIYKGAKIEVIDPHTYQVVFDRPKVTAMSTAVGFDQVLAKFLYSRTEDGRELSGAELSHALAKPWYTYLCGYGPYEFVRYDPNKEIVVRRKDDFPFCHPPIKELHWQIIPDQEQPILRLLGGEIDHTVFGPTQLKRYWIDAADGSEFKGGGKYSTDRYEKMEYSFIGWNHRRAPFDDARVRRALSLAFNRARFLDKCFGGFGALVDSHVWYKNPQHNPELAAMPFDLEFAAHLLDEAGFEDSNGDGVRERVEKDKDGKETRKDFAFTIKGVADSPEWADTLALYRDDLKRIGVDMKIVSLPWGTLRPQVYGEHDFDAFVGNTAIAWDPDFLPTYHSGEAKDGLNVTGYSNPEIDELVEKHRECIDPEKRKELAWKIQEIVWRDQPVTFFIRRDRLAVFTDRLKNVGHAMARPQLVSFDWWLEPR